MCMLQMRQGDELFVMPVPLGWDVDVQSSVTTPRPNDEGVQQGGPGASCRSPSLSATADYLVAAILCKRPCRRGDEAG